MKMTTETLSLLNPGREIQKLLWCPVSGLEGSWPFHARAGYFSADSLGCGDSGVLPRSLLTTLQSIFHENILAYMPQKKKKSFAAVLKLVPTVELVRKRAYDVMDVYAKRFLKAIQCLENGLEDSLTFYAFPKLDAGFILQHDREPES